MAGMDDTSPAGHKDCGQKRLAVDEAAVQSMVATIESWENPFDSSGGDLVSLASGVVAPPQVQQDLLTAKAIGEAALQKFVDDRIMSSHVGSLKSCLTISCKVSQPS